MDVQTEKNLRMLVKVGKVAELTLEGYSVSEIAKKLDLNESTARSIKSRVDKIVNNSTNE